MKFRFGEKDDFEFQTVILKMIFPEYLDMSLIDKDQEITIDVNWDATVKQTIKRICFEIKQWFEPVESMILEIEDENIALIREPDQHQLLDPDI